MTFNGVGSSDPDGTIAKYEWDLDGNGTYETDTGTTATTSRSYATAATVTVGLRVTDNNGATATTTRSLTVQNRAPTASFTVSPNPATTGQTVSFNGSASSDPDGTITKYEWDLDGNGTYETNTGTTATTSRSYSSAATVNVGLRVTDNNDATATTTRSLTVRGSYNAAVLGTTGLLDYWRLGETSGTALADSIGGKTATAQGGVTLGAADPLTNDSNTAAAFDGIQRHREDDCDQPQRDLSGDGRVLDAVDCVLRQRRLGDGVHPQHRHQQRRLLHRPECERHEQPLRRRDWPKRVPQLNRTSPARRPGSGITTPSSSTRPRRAATQIIPYVDGLPVAYVKAGNGIGAGNFANSTLHFMSRNVSTLFGAGALDEVAALQHDSERGDDRTALRRPLRRLTSSAAWAWDQPESAPSPYWRWLDARSATRSPQWRAHVRTTGPATRSYRAPQRLPVRSAVPSPEG